MKYSHENSIKWLIRNELIQIKTRDNACNFKYDTTPLICLRMHALTFMKNSKSIFIFNYEYIRMNEKKLYENK